VKLTTCLFLSMSAGADVIVTTVVRPRLEGVRASAGTALRQLRLHVIALAVVQRARVRFVISSFAIHEDCHSRSRRYAEGSWDAIRLTASATVYAQIAM
jgi:hypothetical protein